MATMRAQVKGWLVPVLPKRWKIIPSQRNYDALAVPSIILKQAGLDPHPAAPQSYHLTRMVITLADPHTDIDKAEDALDANLELLLAAIKKQPLMRFTTAEKVGLSEKYIAYDVTVEIDTEIEDI